MHSGEHHARNIRPGAQNRGHKTRDIRPGAQNQEYITGYAQGSI